MVKEVRARAIFTESLKDEARCWFVRSRLYAYRFDYIFHANDENDNGVNADDVSELYADDASAADKVAGRDARLWSTTIAC